jgi:hypothetical protein
MRSRRRIPDSQLQKLVRRLLASNQPETDTPVIISTMEGAYCSAVGRLLKRGGARVSALVDVALKRESAVTVFLPENAYVGEVISCVAQSDQFTVDLILIQRRAAGQDD